MRLRGRARYLALLLAVLMLSQAGCAQTATTRRTVQAELAQPDSVWARSLTPAFRSTLPKFAQATVTRQHLTYEPESKKLSGTVEVLFTNQSDHALPALYLRTVAKVWGPDTPDDFALTDLQVNGRKAEFTVGQTLITVPLATPLEPGATARLTYAATVTLPTNNFPRSYWRFQQQPVSDLSENAGVYGVGPDVTGLAMPYLLPGGEEGKEFDALPPDRSTENPALVLDEVWLNVPGDYMIIAGGALLDEAAEQEGRKVVHVATAGSGAPSLLVSRTLVKQSQRVGEMEVTAYTSPTVAAYNQALLKNAVDALQVYKELYGPLPYAQLHVVAMPLSGRLAGTYIGGGVLLVAEPYLTDLQMTPPIGLNDPALRPFYEREISTELRKLVYHEVAHAWWGEVVTPDFVTAPWFHESLATASAWFALERTDGAEAGDYWRNYSRLVYGMMRLRGIPDAPVNWPRERYESPVQRTGLQYHKGALFMEQLRQLVGDERFFAALQGYLKAHPLESVPEPGPVGALMDQPGVAELYQRWILETHGDADIGVPAVHDPATRAALFLPPESGN